MSNLTFKKERLRSMANGYSNYILVGLFVILSLYMNSCKNPSSGDENALSLVYGEAVDTSQMISLQELIIQMENIDSLEAKVYGRVEAVCQTKGCWMDIVADDGTPIEKELFVQFKDYAFFMPKDLAGKRVAIEGYAYKETTSVEDLKHYAEDEGLSKEEIDAIVEPEVELKFMASGVQVLD